MWPCLCLEDTEKSRDSGHRGLGHGRTADCDDALNVWADWGRDAMWLKLRTRYRAGTKARGRM
jgi:hypothetical protein